MDIQALWQEIIANPASALAVIFNLIIIESLLSVDNAAVIATMVLDLPKDDRKKALRYGILGAYVFRGLCLLFATVLIQIWWLKPLGGLYLIYLCIKSFAERSRKKETEDVDVADKETNSLYKRLIKKIGPLWATVIAVEVMDLAFSIDNVFAAVAFTDNILLVWAGVFIGILAMRVVAGFFVTIMERFPFLETSAFIVLGLLGVKLSLSIYEHFYPESAFSELMKSDAADWITSVITISIFALPLLSSVLFNVPKRHVKTDTPPPPLPRSESRTGNRG